MALHQYHPKVVHEQFFVVHQYVGHICQFCEVEEERGNIEKICDLKLLSSTVSIIRFYEINRGSQT